MTRRIVVCEPQCTGFVHVPFNSALLATVLQAYPGWPVSFLGEEKHLRLVQEHLKKHKVAFEGAVSWIPIEVPVRGANGFKILRKEWAWCRQVLRKAKHVDVDSVVLCSVTNTGLLFLKPLMWLSRFPKPVVAFLHGILGSLERPAPWKPWHWALHLKRVMRLPHPRRLGYVALGEPIMRHLRLEHPGLARTFVGLDHPYLWPAAAPVSNAGDGAVRFGFLGTTSTIKRFDWFCRLAFEVSRETSNAEFVLAGFATQGGEKTEHCGAVQGVGTKPLDADEFANRASALTYSVWTGEPEHYRLVASASFLDSLYYAKPGIYVRNAYVEHYFERMGDIGYMVDSFEEMRGLLIRLCRCFPKERYQQQCANILRVREELSPSSLSGSFRRIIDALRE